MAPGFELIPPFDHAEAHELALNLVGYEYTMVKKLSHNTSIEDLKQSGKVGYLIVNGYLTVNRKDKSGRAAFTGRNKIVHLGVQVRETHDKRAILRRQFTVQKDGLYDLEARKPGGCTYVEGHVCLSPAFATELLRAGQIHWLDNNDKTVSSATIVNLLKGTTIESTRVKVCGKTGIQMRFKVTVPDAGTDQTARQLQKWFEDEWVDYEKKRGYTSKVDTKRLYRTPVIVGGAVDKSTKAS